MGSGTRNIRPSLSELIDRLTVVQIKEVLAPEGKESCGREIRRVEDALDRIFSSSQRPLSSRFIRLVIALAQMNLHIWKEKERMTQEASEFGRHLKLSHQLNGLRNQLKNALLEEVGAQERSLAKTNTGTEDLAGWDLRVLRSQDSATSAPPATQAFHEHYEYLLTDLIDALTINQMKEVTFQGQRKIALVEESEKIARDVDLCLQCKSIRSSGAFVGLVVLLAQANLHVWKNKDAMQSLPARYGELLEFAQDLNGLRNHVRNIMMATLQESELCHLRATFLSQDKNAWYAPILARLPAVTREAEGAFSVVDADVFNLAFGFSDTDLDDDCRKMLKAGNFHYQTLEGAARDTVLRDIIMRMESGDYWISGDDKKQVWENGWQENLAEYEQTKNVHALTPKFLQAKPVLRLGRRYVAPTHPDFEFGMVDIYRRWVFKKYLRAVNAIYEFGCGSCQHLPVLAELFPETPIHGLDWAEASLKIIEFMVKEKGWKIEGRRFDLFSPDCGFKLAEHSGVYTVGTMEQLGRRFEPFLQYLVMNRPAIVFHIESLAELYDENNLVDCLAKVYDRKRNYLCGYIDRLKELEKERRIEIMEMRRVYFGSMYHDSYSLVAWRPAPLWPAGSSRE